MNQSQKQVLLQAPASARNRRIPLLSFGTCACPPACSSASKDSNSAFSAHFKNYLIFFPLFTMLFITILLSNLHAQFGLVCAQRLKRGDPQQQEDCSMRRRSRTPVHGKVLHCNSSSGFRAQPAYLKQPGHLKHQRTPFPLAGWQLQVTADSV